MVKDNSGKKGPFRDVRKEKRVYRVSLFGTNQPESRAVGVAADENN